MRVELACCETTLLNEIADPAMKRADVALTYAMERWSKSALTWIKERAWKRLERRP